EYFVDGKSYSYTFGNSINGLQEGEKFIIWYDPKKPEISEVDFSRAVLDSSTVYKHAFAVITHVVPRYNYITFFYQINSERHIRGQYIDTAQYISLNLYKGKTLPIIYDESNPSVAYYEY